MIKINSFKEKIYGNMAMVFHRTSVEDLINKIYTSGFKPGTGSLYGIGFYSTYDLESQYQNLNRSRSLYGNIIVKFAVPIQNFLIFDEKEYKKSPQYKNIGEIPENYLIAQLEYFNLKYDQEYLYKYMDNFTSDIAIDIYNENKKNIIKNTDGIIFTGRQDGKVLVAYNTNIIVPISWKFDTEEEFQKVERNMDYLKKVVKTKLSPFDIKSKSSSSFEWIKNAATYKADYTIENNALIWKNGTWKDGEWEKGIWEDGIWENGIWKYGTWEKGFWKKGFWENGTWKDGEWEKGIWEDGIWENGIWKYGTWKDGTWEYGIWEDGTWKDGTWEDGTWKEGVWKGGRWVNGIWKRGIWKSGEWEGGLWESGTWKDGRWKSGTWKDGIWYGGVWYDGIWYDGIWENGTWKGGIWEKGIWKGGWWKAGTWKGGEWESGEWYDGKWYDGTWEKGTWKNGIWEDGWWKGGIWENGTWKGGEWKMGIWDDGTWENGTWKGGEIWNPDTKKYKYSSKNPNETEWSLSYKRA